MFFGMFGSIFLLSQFFQIIQGYSPLGSGVRILPWTIMPLFVAPVAGALSDRIGGHRLMGVGLMLQASGLASIAAISTPTTPYWQLVAPFAVSGIGMAMFWAPVANVVLSAVKPEEQGQASGANNAIRELGGVFGVAVLASVFASYGGYRTHETFVNGMNAAVWIGAGVVALGAVAAFAIGKPRLGARAGAVKAEPLAEAAQRARLDAGGASAARVGRLVGVASLERVSASALSSVPWQAPKPSRHLTSPRSIFRGPTSRSS
jgi:MFS family permease